MKTSFLIATSACALMTGVANAEEVTLSILVDESAAYVAAFDALTEAYSAAHPEISFDIELRPSGGDGDNLIKTRLATGEMADIFEYNSGSLFQALNPTETLMPLDDLPNIENVVAGFLPSVTGPDGKVYAVPFGPSQGGGIFYNRAIYQELGLEIPKTWADFLANAQAAKDAGYTGVYQSYGSTWTSQILFLGDFYNIQAAEPDFAARYTNNEAKFADSPKGLAGFQHTQDLFELGLMNEDAGAATFEEAMAAVATGTAAHYPMLSNALSNIKENIPEHIDDVGFFAVPGETADSNGLTIWTPVAVYIAKTTQHPQEARDFLTWLATPEACQIQMESAGINGPYLIAGCDLPETVPFAVSNLMPYFQAENGTAPALEFQSPIKGPNLEHLIIEVGSGIRPAAEAAALYDQDVVKQARQLGLPNW